MERNEVSVPTNPDQQQDEERIMEFLTGLAPEVEWVAVRGLNDIQNGLIAKLHQQAERWRDVAPSYWVKMSRKFGNPVLTVALQRLVEQGGKPRSPEGLVMVVCRRVMLA
jgi:hypothetical protein